MEIIGRNTNAEATSGECSEELRTILLETGGNVLLIMYRQKIWPNCDLPL